MIWVVSGVFVLLIVAFIGYTEAVNHAITVSEQRVTLLERYYSKYANAVMEEHLAEHHSDDT